ncbi:uncharacterized protein NEMAJ01_1124 [Nematocida major]|uniref:uncharacterized protein n=1 Tax=Nematocida major TaxID=1912982 RepID=UPI0020073E9E|nr:uncharacterized protein NEMAJ01_1124 [Nematocida major]KAH9386228.1 hypothetical protein NEMAJ01_1124 [Nematocida major]
MEGTAENTPKGTAASFHEDSSTSSNDKVVEDDLLDTLKQANKGLAGSIRTSHDTTKALKTQGKKLNRSLKAKKRIRKKVGEDEEITQRIKKEENIIVVKSSFLDKVKNFFSGKTWHENKVNSEAENEEKKAMLSESADESSGLYSTDSSDGSVVDQLEDSGSGDDVDDQLEKTLAGLQSLRQNVHSQTQRIKAQTHAAKEMEILDKDTASRAKKLSKDVKSLK